MQTLAVYFRVLKRVSDHTAERHKDQLNVCQSCYAICLANASHEALQRSWPPARPEGMKRLTRLRLISHLW